MKSAPKKTVPLQVMDIIHAFLQQVLYGNLILTIQDGVVVRVEKTEKFIITTKNRDNKLMPQVNPNQKKILETKIVTELQNIMFGQLTIRMDGGQVEQIEKTEKKRAHEIEGLYGEGI